MTRRIRLVASHDARAPKGEEVTAPARWRNTTAAGGRSKTASSRERCPSLAPQSSFRQSPSLTHFYETATMRTRRQRRASELAGVFGTLSAVLDPTRHIRPKVFISCATSTSPPLTKLDAPGNPRHLVVMAAHNTCRRVSHVRNPAYRSKGLLRAASNLFFFLSLHRHALEWERGPRSHSHPPLMTNVKSVRHEQEFLLSLIPPCPF